MMIEVVNDVQVCFGIMYRRENQRQYELRADTVSECKAWIDAIKMARSGQSLSLSLWKSVMQMARSGNKYENNSYSYKLRLDR